MEEQKIKVLMCCSDFSVKGGMVSVAKNYVNYNHWKNVELTYIPTHKNGTILFKILFFILAYIKIFFLCLVKKFDIAHLHMAERGSMKRKHAIMKLCHFFKIKVIIHHHGGFFDEEYEKMSSKKQKRVEKMLNEAEVNLVLSESLVNPMRQKSKDANIDYLYNAVPLPAQNKYNKNSKKILFLGKICKEKGIYDLLDAIKQIDDKLSKDVKLCICGAGEENEVKKYINKLGIQNRIAKIGWINENERKDIFTDCFVNVLPSYYERLPMTILETMSYGIPCISTNIASIPEVITDNENGFLINPGETEKLADLLLNESKIRSKSEKAYETIKNKFSMEKNIEKLKKIYNNLKG